MKFTKLRLGEVLVNAGVLSDSQLENALKEQRNNKKRLGEILIENHYISEMQLIKCLSDQLKIDYVDVSTIPVSEQVAKMIPESIAMMKLVVPLNVQGRELTVAFADPLDYTTINDLSVYTRYNIKVVICEEAKIKDKIRLIYSSQKAFDAAAQIRKNNEIEYQAQQVQQKAEAEELEDQPVIRLVNNMIEQAVLLAASDIHIEPQDEEMVIRFRVDGHLSVYMKTGIEVMASVISRIKFIGGMNIAEKRIPQDGRINYDSNGRDIDLRISILPTIFGEKAVIRIVTALDFEMDMDNIGFLPDNKAKFERLIHRSNGIILLTGPTGSGKSTTLYTAISELNRSDINIVTVENPVEMIVPGITQVEVSESAGLTFAKVLRSILRQDPDIVMIGEIRDNETAHIASSVSITGHLVFSTLHTYDSPSAVIRLVDMGIPPYMVSSSLAGVVSQRLVRKICLHCIEEYEADEEEKYMMGIPKENKQILHRGCGCEYCGYTGYKGRIAVHEVMPISYDIKIAIHNGKNVEDIKKIARSQGMMTLEENCIELVKQGITTIEELLKLHVSND